LARAANAGAKTPSRGAASERAGNPDTERAVEEAFHRLWAADEKIASTPATTPQGLRAKLLCAVANLREYDGFNEDGTPSLLAEQGNAIPLFLAACADAERLI
jgi:hypothetical protein